MSTQAFIYTLIGGEDKAFTLLIDPSDPGNASSFTIPVASGLTYLYDVDWGDGTKTTNRTGSASHKYASGGVYEVRITGTFPRIYFNNTGDKLKVIGILNWGQTDFSSNQTGAFYGLSNLTEIPTASDAWYNSIINGALMFRGTSLTNLPSNMTLENLTSGSFMFYLTNLQSLPSSLTLASLTNGNSMFRNTLIESLPSGMTLDNLTNGSSMFQQTNLQSLPSTMTLDNLTNGSYMFYNNSLTDLPTGITLANLTSGAQMFFGNTIKTSRYSQLLVDMAKNNNNNNVSFHGGYSKYNSKGQTARNALIARGWTITDGGYDTGGL